MARQKTIPVDTGKAGDRAPTRQERMAEIGVKWLKSETSNVKTVSESLALIEPFIVDTMNGLGIPTSETKADFSSKVMLGKVQIFGELLGEDSTVSLGLQSVAQNFGIVLTGNTLADRLYCYALATLRKGSKCPSVGSDSFWSIAAIGGGTTMQNPTIKALRNILHKLGGFLTELGYRERSAESDRKSKDKETVKPAAPPSANNANSQELAQTVEAIVSGVVSQSQFSLLDVVRQCLVETLKASGPTPAWVAVTFSAEFIAECEAALVESN